MTKSILLILVFLLLLQAPTLFLFIQSCRNTNKIQVLANEDEGAERGPDFEGRKAADNPSDPKDSTVRPAGQSAAARADSSTTGVLAGDGKNVQGEKAKAASQSGPNGGLSVRSEKGNEGEQGSSYPGAPVGSSLPAGAGTLGEAALHAGADGQEEVPGTKEGMAVDLTSERAVGTGQKSAAMAAKAASYGSQGTSNLSSTGGAGQGGSNIAEALTGKGSSATASRPPRGSPGLPDVSGPGGQGTGTLAAAATNADQAAPRSAGQLSGSITLADVENAAFLPKLTGQADGSTKDGSSAGIPGSNSSAGETGGGDSSGTYAGRRDYKEARDAYLSPGGGTGRSFADAGASFASDRSYASKPENSVQRKYGEKDSEADSSSGETALGKRLFKSRKAKTKPSANKPKTTVYNDSGYPIQSEIGGLSEEAILKLLFLTYIGAPVSLILIYLGYETTQTIKARRKERERLAAIEWRQRVIGAQRPKPYK